MKRFSLTLLVLALSAVAGRSARAQITLVPGVTQKVSLAPKFIASADFDHDGRQDAVVANSVSSKISVLFGNADGAFSVGLDASVGRVLRGIATGDLNQDGNPDIAVVDFLDSRVFVVTSNFDTHTKAVSLNRPASFKVGLRPIDIAIGHFGAQPCTQDTHPCNDIVTANLTANKATVLLNLGGNKGFTPLGDLDLGRTPKRIIAVDLNGDGFDDIVSVNTGSSGADDVTVLLNTGVGSFRFPVNFLVGVGAKDIKVADVNNDGVPDLLVLDAGATGVANQFTVSVLVNRTQIVGGKPVGTGSFNSLSPVQLRCPSTLNGILINCSPNFIASGDFNIDANADFVVSFLTRPVSGSTSTPGLIEAFAGRGDGTFDFATQINVGFDPEGVVAGDFTGDGIADVGVAENGTTSVRILRSLPPPPEPIAGPCTSTAQCVSGAFCVDHTCCTTNSCPSGEFCNIFSSLGRCAPPAPNGSACDPNGEPTQCASGNCVDGFCCASALCTGGLFCNTGQCGPPAGNGTLCNDPSQCDSGNCVDGVCCASASCDAGQACNIPHNLGQCTPTAPNGTPCTDAAQCNSGNCIDGACCDSVSCSNGQFCNTGTCEPPGGNGTQCTLGVQCNSGNCVDDTCCASANCQAGQFCNIPGSLGQCSQPGPNGTPCNNPVQCLSTFCVDGFCCSTGSCGVDQFCNTGQCDTPAGNGVPCNNGAQCDSGNCVDGVCCLSASCLSGEACNLQSNPGQCTAKSGLGAACNSAAQCQSGFCTNNVCCNTSACQIGQVCGSSGACVVPPPPTATPTRTPTPTATTTPQPTGRPCIAGSQCVSGNCVDSICCGVPFCPSGTACNVSGKEGQCVVIPTATPTVPQNIGAPCNTPGQCLSSHCIDGACCGSVSCPSGEFCNISGHAGTCFLPATPTPLPIGFQCTDDTQCTSLHCVTSVCCATVCADGQACNVPGKVGQCALAPTPTNTPIPSPTTLPLGATCNANNPGACDSGFCTNNVCCDTDSCPDGQRCDIFLFEGSCGDQLDVDNPCDKGTDCFTGLICSSVTGLCDVAPSPTPTLLPLNPSPTAGLIVHNSVGGGCSIGSGTDATGLWMIAGLPLAFWLRNRLTRVRVRIHRRARVQ